MSTISITAYCDLEYSVGFVYLQIHSSVVNMHAFVLPVYLCIMCVLCVCVCVLGLRGARDGDEAF